MQIKLERTSSTEVKLTIILGEKDLNPITTDVFAEFGKNITVAGFRPGNAPRQMVENQVGAGKIQAEVIEHAAGKFYAKAIQEENLRPSANPHVEVRKFVAYSELELEFKVEVFPPVKLANYKDIKKTKKVVKIDDKEINRVVESLRIRAAKRGEVKRPAKDNDEVLVDMQGSRDGKAVPGTVAKDYTVLIGSKRFVSGFEAALVGLSEGDKKEFDVTFPKDYPEVFLQDKKVTFAVVIKKVSEIKLPNVDDDFAKAIGPFKNLAELKNDIENQLKAEAEQVASRELADSIVNEVSQKSALDLPAGLVTRQTEALWQEFNESLAKQEQPLEEYLKEQAKTRAEMDEAFTNQARERIRTALVLSEVAKAENLIVSPEELEIRKQLLAGQYQDPKFRAELETAQARRDLADQILIEKTIDKLVSYATAQ